MPPDLSFRASLKNVAVEERIDLLVHRPLGYLVARAAYPTSLSPDVLTVFSMFVGIASGACFLSAPLLGRPHHVAGALLLIASAVLDCSDGQLARMRKSSSRYGRMLDGAVDAVVQIAVVPSAIFAMMARRGWHHSSTWAWGFLAVLAILSGVRHTTLYDQFKNVFVRNTEPNPRDCDDLEEVERDWLQLQRKGSPRLIDRARFAMYRLHLSLVRQTMAWIDPHIPPRFSQMPAYSAANAARYHALNDELMRAWSYFGIGTHIFLFAACLMYDRLELYVVLRLVGFNACLLTLIPRQRRASRTFFDAPATTDLHNGIAA